MICHKKVLVYCAIFVMVTHPWWGVGGQVICGIIIIIIIIHRIYIAPYPFWLNAQGALQHRQNKLQTWQENRIYMYTIKKEYLSSKCKLNKWVLMIWLLTKFDQCKIRNSGTLQSLLVHWHTSIMRWSNRSQVHTLKYSMEPTGLPILSCYFMIHPL